MMEEDKKPPPARYKTIAKKYLVDLTHILGKGTFATTYLCRLKNEQSHLLACKMLNK
jgi:hypothetical protein